MKAVLRIVCGYFSFMPLQRWVNIVGAALLVIGMLLTLWAPDARTSINMTAALAIPGAFLLALLPITMGGMALRFASSRSLMHLRPHGRACMLLGSTLTIALLAAVLALPVLAQSHVFSHFGLRHLSASARPCEWFVGGGAFTVAAWLIMFVSSSSRMFTSFGPMLLGVLLFVISGRMTSFESGWTVAAVILSAWAVFAIWYSRVERVGRPFWTGENEPLGFGISAIGPLERFASIGGGDPLARAMRQYLLGFSSPLAAMAIGVFSGLLVLGLATQLPPEIRLRQPPTSLLFVLTFASSSMAYMIVRRARHLWLRTGLDRPALFRLAERFGLSTTLLVFCIGAAILVAGSVPGRREQFLNLTLYAATLGALTICLFYLALSLTRGWNVEDVIAGLGLFVPSMVVNAVIMPQAKSSTTSILIAAGLFALLVPLLRWHAARRWRALDWRVAKLPRSGRR